MEALINWIKSNKSVTITLFIAVVSVITLLLRGPEEVVKTETVTRTVEVEKIVYRDIVKTVEKDRIIKTVETKPDGSQITREEIIKDKEKSDDKSIEGEKRNEREYRETYSSVSSRSRYRIGVNIPVRLSPSYDDLGISAGVRLATLPVFLETYVVPKKLEFRVGLSLEF